MLCRRRSDMESALGYAFRSCGILPLHLENRGCKVRPHWDNCITGRLTSVPLGCVSNADSRQGLHLEWMFRDVLSHSHADSYSDVPAGGFAQPHVKALFDYAFSCDSCKALCISAGACCIEIFLGGS